MTTEQSQITLAQLLTMTGGFIDQATQASDREDWVTRILDKCGSDPGAWIYSNDSAHLLSAMITTATGVSALAHARTKLFDPLGIICQPADEQVSEPGDLSLANTGFGWAKDPQGNSTGAYGLRLTAHDLAKIGLLFLHEGKWEGRQIVPVAWVRKAIARLVDNDNIDGYGYLWWNGKTSEGEPWYAALGPGGQRPIVMPKRDRVMVVPVDANQAAGVSDSDAESAVGQMVESTVLAFPKQP